jgi:hypothetical protein
VQKKRAFNCHDNKQTRKLLFTRGFQISGFLVVACLEMSMLISQKLDQDASTFAGDTQHSDIKWHPVRDILAVSSFAQGLGGYVSFVSKKVKTI